MRRTLLKRLLNVAGESPDFRAKPGSRNLLLDAQMSPYKEQFKDYWATPVPFADREYGEKPKLGDPIPTTRATTAVVVAKNRYADRDKVEAGEENDYKVLMLFRKGKGRFTKDQFVFPSSPLCSADLADDWDRFLKRHGVTSHWPDLYHRLGAMRCLFSYTNLLVVPKEGGVLAEVEGPPGPRKWHMIVHSHPKSLRHLLDVLELPMESVLAQMLPFRQLVTPESESFRYENNTYLIPLEKIPEVTYTIHVDGEQLVWVSPMEAMARFNAGIMTMPTPNLITLSELNNDCPKFSDVAARNNREAPRRVMPELYRHGQTKVATVLLPGDFAHSATTPEDKAAEYVRRFVYEKDYPFGVRAVFEERPATPSEIATPLEKEKPALLEEANENDMVYASVPYPTRQPRAAGRTAYPVPEYTFQEGGENVDGLIPPRREYMHMSDGDSNVTPQAQQRQRQQQHAGEDEMHLGKGVQSSTTRAENLFSKFD